MQRIYTLLILIFFIPLISFGQTYDKKIKIKEQMWQSDDEDFKATAVPEKWQNESAVVLSKKMEYHVKKEVFFNILNENLYIHHRIKLLDEAAVKDFSEISFESSQYNIDGFAFGNQMEVFLGVKVVKPNGQEKEINADDAVAMESSSDKSKLTYKKLAIPDLEPGDILDYYQCIEIKFIYGNFDRILYPLAGKYPTVKQKIDLHIMRKCNINAISLNGAPELKRNPNFKDKDVYSLELENSDKVNLDQRWIYSNRTVPTINFQAHFPRNNKKGMYYYFRGEQGKLQSKITERKLLDYTNHIASSSHKFESVLSSDKFPWTTEMKNFISSNHKKEKDKEKIVKEAYNHLRQRRFVANYEDQLLNNKSYRFGLNNYAFVTNMSRFLKKKKIDHDLILVSPRTVSDINDLVLGHDLFWVIRVNTPKPFYINSFDRFSHYNEVEPAFMGTNAYAVNMLKKKKNRTLDKIIIPSGNYDANRDLVTLEVDILEDKPEQMLVKRSVDLKGINRYSEIYQVLTPYDYLEAGDLKKHKISWMGDQYNRKKLKEEYEQKVAIRKEQDDKDRLEYLKEKIETDLESKVIDYNSFNLLQSGLWDDKPTLKYEDNFTIEGLSVVNGSDYLIEAGKLISRQIALEKEELIRKDNVFMISPRSYEYNITINIPEGYDVKGLEKFNVNISNSTGGFVSKAAMNNGKVVISTLKYYSHDYENVDKWPEMVAFLEAAYDFTHQKLLFMKIKTNNF